MVSVLVLGAYEVTSGGAPSLHETCMITSNVGRAKCTSFISA